MATGKHTGEAGVKAAGVQYWSSSASKSALACDNSVKLHLFGCKLAALLKGFRQDYVFRAHVPCVENVRIFATDGAVSVT